jgi:hypothetical protein
MKGVEIFLKSQLNEITAKQEKTDQFMYLLFFLVTIILVLAFCFSISSCNLQHADS